MIELEHCESLDAAIQTPLWGQVIVQLLSILLAGALVVFAKSLNVRCDIELIVRLRIARLTRLTAVLKRAAIPMFVVEFRDPQNPFTFAAPFVPKAPCMKQCRT